MTAGVTEFAGLAPAAGAALARGLTIAAGLGGELGGINNPIPALGPAAYFKFNTGITVTGAGVSQWDDQSGNARHLLQAVDANRAPLQGDGSILFNGVDEWLKCGAFTLNQPYTIYARVMQVAWASSNRFFSGNAGASMEILQDNTGGVSPDLTINAGATVARNGNLAVGAYGSVAAVFNGASSSLLINATTETTGNAGAGNAGGFTLGARGNPEILFSNIQVKEVAIFASAHDAATRASVIAYLSTL